MLTILFIIFSVYLGVSSSNCKDRGGEYVRKMNGIYKCMYEEKK